MSPIKTFVRLLRGHEKLIMLGPLAISSKLLNNTLNEICPTLILLIDGGDKHLSKLSPAYQKMVVSLGDGDSRQKKAMPTIALSPIKNFSDLAFAFLGLTKSKQKWKKISLLGLSSTSHETRLDHFLFNIGEIQKFICKKLWLKK